jgi:hypothetical protein
MKSKSQLSRNIFELELHQVSCSPTLELISIRRPHIGRTISSAKRRFERRKGSSSVYCVIHNTESVDDDKNVSQALDGRCKDMIRGYHASVVSLALAVSCMPVIVENPKNLMYLHLGENSVDAVRHMTHSLDVNIVLRLSYHLAEEPLHSPSNI